MHSNIENGGIPTFIPTAEWQELPDRDIPLPFYVEQKLTLGGSRKARISPEYQMKILSHREKTKQQEADIKCEVEHHLEGKVEEHIEVSSHTDHSKKYNAYKYKDNNLSDNQTLKGSLQSVSCKGCGK